MIIKDKYENLIREMETHDLHILKELITSLYYRPDFQFNDPMRVEYRGFPKELDQDRTGTNKALRLLEKQFKVLQTTEPPFSPSHQDAGVNIKISSKKNFATLKEILDAQARPSDSEDKVQISIDRESGIYAQKGEVKLSYPIKNNRYLLITMLCKNKIVEARSLRTLYKTNQLISAAVAGINKNFSNKLGLEADLILHLKTGGYKLNVARYEISWPQP